MIIITRQNHFRGHGRLHPFGWLYAATIDGKEILAGHDRLDSIVSVAKRKFPKTPIVRAWDGKEVR